MTTLELSVRFGKALVVRDVDFVEPVLYPLLRKDLLNQGMMTVAVVKERVETVGENNLKFL